MPALARGQENTVAIINWFITINGVLTTANSVEYRIFDITAGLPGVQVFPTAPDFEAVSTGPGNFDAGSYYAYDNTAAKGYTPLLTATVGTHRIEWRWKITAGAPLQAGFEDFEVLVQSAGSSVDTYCSIQDIRDEGITVAMASDVKVLSTITVMQEILDRMCRQWFIPKALVLSIDGNDADTMHFGVPIISIDYVKLNRDPNELDSTLYRVYNQRVYPDDRRNPRITLIRSDEIRDIFVRPASYGPAKFRKGRQNQEVKGVFGFTEPNGAVPEAIKRALCILTIEKLQAPLFTDPATPSPIPPPPPIVGQLLEEETDDHRRKYAKLGGALAARAPGLTGITASQEVLDIVKLYRAPLGMATPAHWGLG